MPRPRANPFGMKVRQVYPVDQPRASLGNLPDQKALARRFMKGGDELPDEDSKPEAQSAEDGAFPDQLAFLHELASHGGDISPLIPPDRVDEIGNRAVREWEIDQGSRQAWVEVAERGLMLATQERGDDEAEKEYPFVGASDVHYPILTTAVTQFNARAMPELVKGDKAVGVKTFNPPPRRVPTIGHNGGPPMGAQAPSPMPQGQEPPTPVPAAQAQEEAESVAARIKQARGERVAHFLNFLIFYRMDNWEGETDLLLMESPVTGMGFKKVYMGPEGLRSDYVSALRLTVNNSTTSLQRCPRITQDFDIYPYEIEQGIAAGKWRDRDLSVMGDDPEAPRVWIEQHRLEDLDGDGLPEPYIVTVDVQTRRAVCIQAGYALNDITVNPTTMRVTRIDRWVPFPAFTFLPDPRGRYYGLGLAKLLDAITDSVDTSINQLIDAGNAQIAGGGFIGANVRLQGSGQGGAIYKQPGEWQTVSTNGADLRQALYEFTVPQPSQVTMQMLELLLAAAKDVASVKDVVTGDAPATAPVGTTLALLNQALQVFSAIYKRIYRGFRDEFRLMFQCLKRWATEKEKMEYNEVTGGDFVEDFSGDGTDIQPVADPSVVTRMQKIARIQTISQIAESPVGQAAGMLQPGPAQEIVTEMLNAIDIDRPDRFVAAVPPNPEVLAKIQDMKAAAELKEAKATHIDAEITLDHAEAHEKAAGTVKTMGEVGEQTHRIHQEAHRVAKEGVLPVPGIGHGNEKHEMGHPAPPPMIAPINPNPEPAPVAAGGV